MAKADQDKTISRGEVIIRYIHLDGRANALITYPNGMWKVEIFASEQHAAEFADQSNMDLTVNENAHDNE